MLCIETNKLINHNYLLSTLLKKMLVFAVY